MTGAATIDANADIAIRHPLLRVDHFPVLILVGRTLGDLGIVADHVVPAALVELVLERQALGVGPQGHDDGITALRRRPEDVGAQYDAVVHRNRHVPIDVHAVGDGALSFCIVFCFLHIDFECASDRTGT
jgi:hypothetical protein